MLDPFAQLFQHCWGHARSLRMVYKDLWVVTFPRCPVGPNNVGSCCIRLHTTANTDETTPNIHGATILGVVVSVCTPLPTRTKQLPTFMAQQFWELLCPFAHHCQHGRNNSQHSWRNNFGSCCVRLHTTANTDETTPNIHGATILGVVVSVCTPLPTRTKQLPTFMAQQFWELLCPFAHHCQHGRNNSQHSWRNNFGSCCVRLHTTAKTDETTPNIHGATILGVVVSVCTPLPTRTKQLPTFMAQQFWELLCPFAHHCQNGRNNSQHSWRNNFGSCCVRLHTTANTDETTPNIHGATILGVVVSVCMQPYTVCLLHFLDSKPRANRRNIGD